MQSRQQSVVNLLVVATSDDTEYTSQTYNLYTVHTCLTILLLMRLEHDCLRPGAEQPLHISDIETLHQSYVPTKYFQKEFTFPCHVLQMTRGFYTQAVPCASTPRPLFSAHRHSKPAAREILPLRHPGDLIIGGPGPAHSPPDPPEPHTRHLLDWFFNDIW